VAAASVLLAACSSGASGTSTTTTTGGGGTATTTPDLSGVTLTFGDLFKQYETVMTATHALAGAPYKVVWANFAAGPSIIAAETGGSVDLGGTAETPLVFAQAAGDPVQVVAATTGAYPTTSPYDLLVPASSSIRTVAQLRGHTVAAQPGTIAQYLLVRVLQRAGLAATSVTVDNLSFVDASAAVTNGEVDAAVVPQPLAAADLQTGKVRLLTSGAGYVQTLGYLVASRSALADPATSAAIADFIVRLFKAKAEVAKDPQLGVDTYMTTYGVPESVASAAARSGQSVATPITPAIVAYQQAEADTFLRLGQLTSRVDAAKVFDLPFNRAVDARAGLGT
jgi:sulfonate transport system substrate-binding protein